MSSSAATIPKLRFPEFKEIWRREALKTLSSKSISYGIVQTGSAVEGGVKCVRVVDLTKPRIELSELITTTEKISQSYKKTILSEGEIMVALRGEIGLVAIVPRELEGSNLTRGIARISPKKSSVHSSYLLWALRSPECRMEFLKQVNGSALKEIPIGGLNKIPVQLTTLPEQQKIADFLTAVDGRIAQLIQKKALLEDYKKGVMQQLFTQAIRFKDDHGNEFPEWEEKRLGALCSTFKSGKGITSGDITEEGDYPVYGGNGLRGYTDVFTHDGEFLLIGRQGALCGNINRVSGKSFISEHAIAVAGNKASNTEWLAQRLDYLNLNRLSESSAQPGLAVNKLERLKLLTPSLPEQTKIADFLSALDRKIESVATQITATQTFKRGLLQQMFV